MPYSCLKRMNIRSSLYSFCRVIIKVGYSLIINNQIGHQRQVCSDSPDPATCWANDRNGKSLHVRVDSLRPLAVDTDEKLIPKELSRKIHDQFIVYDAPVGLFHL